MPHRRTRSYFHLHMISDATGETILAVARAASAQYPSAHPIEHAYPLIRTKEQLDRVLRDIEAAPGIVLFTLIDADLTRLVETRCAQLNCPAVSILEPALNTFKSYLGTEQTPRIGGQHVLDKQYFRRIDALNYTLIHDDGQHGEGWSNADIILVGISRTSKTPTCIYLANRGFKTANIPLVGGIEPSSRLFELDGPTIIGLVASAERIRQVRENRLLGLNADCDVTYTDRIAIAEEIRASKRLFKSNNVPVIDVSRRSIEETAAAVIALHQDRVQGQPG